MNLLAIETSTEACSCALLVNDEILVRESIVPRRHAELILDMAEQVLAEAEIHRTQLDAVAFGRGPGAFTGVRIACAVTQGIALALDLPVMPVSSLATLAQGAFREFKEQHVLVAIDARMGEIYWAAYQCDGQGIMRLYGEPECVLPPEYLPLPEEQIWHGCGSAWENYVEILRKRLNGRISTWQGNRYPLAQDILPLAREGFEQGLDVAAIHTLPVYIRDRITQA